MTKASAPTPAVQHLPTLLRRIQTGDILVPAFQRGFVWKPKQILELLTSVYRGFPVGSLLLWMVDDGAINPQRLMGPPFPPVPQKSHRHYVLDGHQRLASLYGTLYGDPQDERFDVVFDLRTEQFDFKDQVSGDACLRLGDLFAPKAFMASQSNIAALADGDELLDRAIGLHASFQEYMIPLVTIAQREVNEVVQIFERINNTGTKLSAVDFLRALTWSQGFDLNRQIGDLAALARAEGFQFGPDRIARLFAVVMGKDPTAEDMMSLRTCSVAELRSGVAETKKVLKKTCEFLRQDANIHSALLVPYDAQLLVVGRLFASSGLNPKRGARKQVSRWLLASTLNEEFQGKADHRVARIVRSVDGTLSSGGDLLGAELNVTAEMLLERRLLRGGALSGGVSLLFAQNAPRSLITGDCIDTAAYLAPEQFAPLVPVEDLGGASKRTHPSAKVLANLALCSNAGEARKLQRDGWPATLGSLRERLGTQQTRQVLASQFVDTRGLGLLEGGDVRQFLMRRAKQVLAVAEKLLSS